MKNIICIYSNKKNRAIIISKMGKCNTMWLVIILSLISQISFGQVPANDEIQNATNIVTLPFEEADVQLQNATAASGGGMNGCDFQNLVTRIYYRYKPIVNETVSVSTSISLQEAINVKVYESDVDFASSDTNLTQVDDSGCGYSRNVIMTLQANHVYYFLVSGQYVTTIYVKNFDYSDVINIPDEDFKYKLTSTFCADTNGDGDLDGDVDANNDFEIQISEAQSVNGLSVGGTSISSIEGLSSFINLTYLRVQGTYITSLNIASLTQLETILISNNLDLPLLDVSNQNSLKSLNCGNNPIMSSIEFGTILNLENLVCYNNDLSSLNTSSNLKYLDCSGNSITQLDVNSYTDLEYLSCSSNLITDLSVTNLTNLTELWCQNGNLSIVDLDGATSLTEVQLDGNSLTEVDTSSLINLEILFLGNNPNLTFLNTKNGNEEQVIQIANNSNLAFACVDEFERDYVQSAIQISAPSCVVNLYCSFTPGGNYNTITGNITFDADNNGCDSNDVLYPFNKININDGVNTEATFTNNSGEYNFYTQAGNFTITPDFENPSFFNATPIDATINFADTNNNVEIQDFCITPNGVHPDVEIVLASTIPARPGFEAEYLITYKNKGNQTLSGGVTLSYNAEVLDYVSSNQTPISQSGTFVNWSYLDLLPFESRSIEVTFNVNAPDDIPAMNIGDVLDFIVEVDPIMGDDFPNDNTFEYDQTVVGSYDPNDITCLQGDIVDPSEIGNYLHYLVRFENTGNAAAENVVVKMEIDPAQFDIGTLQLLSSSHNADVRVRNDIIEFIFEGIYLGASGGHGNILLRMQTKEDLQTNDTVTKDAEIFFDYNFPIETNDANTTFATLSNPNYETDKSVSLYPNPVKDVLNIKANNVITSVSIYDVQGRLLQTKMNTSSTLEVDLSTKSNGIYFVKITTEKGTNIEKIIKD